MFYRIMCTMREMCSLTKTAESTVGAAAIELGLTTMAAHPVCGRKPTPASECGEDVTIGTLTTM